MESPKTILHRAPKPLWGFGPAGWVLLLIAAALAACLIVGYDLRFQILRAITATLGADAMMVFVASLPFYAMDFTPPVSPSPQFGLPAMCGCLIALHVHPRRFRAWRYLAVATLGILTPPAQAYVGAKWLTPLFTPIGVAFDPRAMSWGLGAASAILAAAAVAVVAFATRSVWVTCGMAVLGLWSAAEAIEETRQAFGLTPVLPVNLVAALSYERWAWQVIFWALVITWAVTARSRWPRPSACPGCGYDLKGLRAGRCPECGATIPVVAGQPAGGGPAAREGA